MNPVLSTSLRAAAHVCRYGLALVFLYAGVMKGLDPVGFANEIEGYGLVSGWLASLAAYILIPFELAVGLALLINFRPVPGLIAANGLMVMFIAAIGFALVTDQPLESCGCFGKNSARTPETSAVTSIEATRLRWKSTMSARLSILTCCAST